MSDILTYKPVSIPNGLVIDFGMPTSAGNMLLTEIVTGSVGALEATDKANKLAASVGPYQLANSPENLGIIRLFFSGEGAASGVSVSEFEPYFDGEIYEIYTEFSSPMSLEEKRYEISTYDKQVLLGKEFLSYTHKAVRNPLNFTATQGNISDPSKDLDGVPYIDLSWHPINTGHCTDPTYTNQTSCEASSTGGYCREVLITPAYCSDPSLLTEATCIWTGCSDPQFTNPTDCTASGCSDGISANPTACAAAGSCDTDPETNNTQALCLAASGVWTFETWTYPSVWTYSSTWYPLVTDQKGPVMCVRKNDEELGLMEVQFNPSSAGSHCLGSGGNNGGKCKYSVYNDESASWVWYNANATKEWCMETTQTNSSWNHIFWAWFEDDNVFNSIDNNWFPSPETINQWKEFNVKTSDRIVNPPETHLIQTGNSKRILYGDTNDWFGNGLTDGQSVHPWWITSTFDFEDPVPDYVDTSVTTYECSDTTDSCSDGVTITQAACEAVPATWTVVTHTNQTDCETAGFTWNGTTVTTWNTVWNTYEHEVKIDPDYYQNIGFLPHSFTVNTTYSQPRTLYGYSDSVNTANAPLIRFLAPQQNYSVTYRNFGTPDRYRIYRSPAWKYGTYAHPESDWQLGIWTLAGEMNHTSDEGYMYFTDDKQELLRQGVKKQEHIYYKITAVWDRWEWKQGIDYTRWRISPNKWDPAYNSNNSFSTLYNAGYGYCSDGSNSGYSTCVNAGWCNGGGSNGQGNSAYNGNPSGCTSTGGGYWDNGHCPSHCDGSGTFGYGGTDQFLCTVDLGNWMECQSSSWGNYTYQYAGNTWQTNAIDYAYDVQAVIIDDNSYKRSHRIKGYFKAPSTETYTFRVVGDDSIYLWIGTTSQTPTQVEQSVTSSNWVAAAPGSHPDVSNSGTINLIEGEIYPIVLYNGNHYGPGTCHLYWSTPTIAEMSNGTDIFHKETTFHTNEGQDNVEGHPSSTVWSWFNT